MKITIFEPQDNEEYQLKEFTFDTVTNEKKFTGNSYRKLNDIIPSETNAFKVFSQNLRIKNRIIFYSAKNKQSNVFELIID